MPIRKNRTGGVKGIKESEGSVSSRSSTGSAKAKTSADLQDLPKSVGSAEFEKMKAELEAERDDKLKPKLTGVEPSEAATIMLRILSRNQSQELSPEDQKISEKILGSLRAQYNIAESVYESANPQRDEFIDDLSDALEIANERRSQITQANAEEVYDTATMPNSDNTSSTGNFGPVEDSLYDTIATPDGFVGYQEAPYATDALPFAQKNNGVAKDLYVVPIKDRNRDQTKRARAGDVFSALKKAPGKKTGKPLPSPFDVTQNDGQSVSGQGSEDKTPVPAPRKKPPVPVSRSNSEDGQIFPTAAQRRAVRKELNRRNDTAKAVVDPRVLADLGMTEEEFNKFDASVLGSEAGIDSSFDEAVARATSSESSGVVNLGGATETNIDEYFSNIYDDPQSIERSETNLVSPADSYANAENLYGNQDAVQEQ